MITPVADTVAVVSDVAVTVMRSGPIVAVDVSVDVTVGVTVELGRPL